MTRSGKPSLMPNSYIESRNDDLSYIESGTTVGAVTKRAGGSIVISPAALTFPVRKQSDEMWPSPVARSDTLNRFSSGPQSDWFGAQTMEGLNNAADSSAYSWVKYDPINSRRLSENSSSVNRCWRTLSYRRAKKSNSRW